MNHWKLLFFKFIAFGFGIGIALSIGYSIWYYSANRIKPPEPWDSTKITAVYTDINLDISDHLVASFHYKIQNNTKFDYYLPTTANSAFKILSDGRGIVNDERISWQVGLYIPEGQNVNTAFKVTYDYNDKYPYASRNDKNKLEEFINSRAKEFDGFLILDNSKRYKIAFLNDWKEKSKH